MKRRSKIVNLFGSLCALLLFAVPAAACADTPGEQTPKNYSVSVTQSADYTLTPSADSAKEGDTITVAAEVTNSDKYLTGVTYNGTACKQTESGYSFVMPAADVTLAATLEEYKEVLSDGNGSGGADFFVAFASYNPKTVVKADSGNATLSLVFNASYMTILNYAITSSDPAVIPEEAISLYETHASQSNVINGVNLIIDVSEVNLGSTWLTMEFENGNVSSQSGTIVVKITVAETLQLEKWTQTLVFDLENIDENATYHVHLYDMNYVNGSDGKYYQAFDDLTATDGKVTIQIEYVVGHSYSLEFAVMGENGTLTYHDLSETIGSGSTVTGFNQFKNGRLSFIDEGTSLEITVLRDTHT